MVIEVWSIMNTYQNWRLLWIVIHIIVVTTSIDDMIIGIVLEMVGMQLMKEL